MYERFETLAQFNGKWLSTKFTRSISTQRLTSEPTAAVTGPTSQYMLYERIETKKNYWPQNEYMHEIDNVYTTEAWREARTSDTVMVITGSADKLRDALFMTMAII